MATLIGRWFHSWRRDPVTGARVREWQGQVEDVVEDNERPAYLVQLYSWLDGTATDGLRLVERADMNTWTFYETNDAMRLAMGCEERSDSPSGDVCGDEPTHRAETGMGFLYVCGHHAKYYSAARPRGES